MRAKLQGGSKTRDSKDQQEAVPFSNEVNMTNCYDLCHTFFHWHSPIHFNHLISFWLVGGYLGPFDSVEEAYQKGLHTLYGLIYEEGVLKVSDRDKNMIEFVESAQRKPNSCKHRGSCTTPYFWFYGFLDWGKTGNIMLSDGALKKKREVAVNLDHLESHLVRSYGRGRKHVAHFNPTPDSLKPLLENVTNIFSLVLRGCASLPSADFPLQILQGLAVLEISGSSYLTTIPENTIPLLVNLQYLNLSDLIIENLPDGFFDNLKSLRWLIIRGCSKLRSLPPIVSYALEGLDLSHCTALQELASIIGSKSLRVINLSYTALTDIPHLQSTDLNHMFLRGSKLGDIEFLTKKLYYLKVLDLSGARDVKRIDKLHLVSTITYLDLSRTQIKYLEFNVEEDAEGCLRIMILRDCTSLRKLPSLRVQPYIEILDISGCEKIHQLPADLSSLRNLMELNLSGCKGLRVLREGSFDQMSRLCKLDLSGTKFKHLPYFANLTCLSVLSLRDLELDSLETLKSLSDLVELDLKGLKITSSQELQLDLLEFLEKLEILNLSQTSVAKLPNMSNLASLRELILADCQCLIAVPDLQTLPNLEVLDLSLADGSDVSCQAEIEFEAQSGVWFSVPSSLQKLVLTNRSGVHKLFPLTSLGSLEFLDLRGTDVTSIPRHYVEQIKCIRLPDQIDFSEVGSSGMGNRQQVINLDGNIQGGVSKPFEIHIVSSFEVKSSPTNQASSSSQPSGFDRFRHEFTKLESLISDMQEILKSSTAANGKNQSFKLQKLHSDLKHIQKNFDRLKSSQNCKISDELLRELMGAATHLSAAEFVEDSSSFMQLLRIVVKLKLLIPRTEAELPESSEITKTTKKKKAWFEKSKNKEEENGVDIATELMSSNEYQDLLNSYEALTVIEKQCLLCFSVFPCNDQDNGNNTAGGLVVKKRMLIYWWVGEGFIAPNAKANPNPEPETIEEIGEQILKVLTSKGFIEPVMEKGPEPTSCQMKPFVHSFVTSKAKEEGFFDFNQENGKLTPHFTRSKRACLLDNATSSSCKLWESYIHSPKSLKSFTHIRTLFNVNESVVDIKPEWFSMMKFLSVLHLGSWRSDNPEPIELVDQLCLEELKNMKHLRLLSLQGLPTIMKLPDSVCKLTRLIILDLRECSYLEELPTDIGCLQNLTHLDMTNCRLLTKLPKGIRLLSKLEVLKGFAITNLGSGSKACVLTDLLNLKKLRKLSIIVNVNIFPNDKELQVLKAMDNLCNLKILWENDYNIDDRRLCQPAAEDAINQEDPGLSKWKKLKCWEHQSAENDKEETSRSKDLGNIEKLELWCFPGETAPHWLDPSELKKLKKLYIVGGSLPNLRGGTDQNKWNVTTLRFKHLPKLDIQWRNLKTMFPNLTYLEKHQCPNLILYPCDDNGVWRNLMEPSEA